MSSEAPKVDTPNQHGYKLKLGKFHRYTGKKNIKKVRNVSLKKQIRDLDRLVTKEGMPAEIIEAKKAELKELKGKMKHRKNALRNAAKYKEIRLNEKKKCMKMQKRAEKEIDQIKNRIISEGESIEEFEAKKEEDTKKQQDILEQCDKDLEYIIHFPKTEKYISLYIKTEMPEKVLQKRDELRELVSKQVNSNKNFK